MSLLKRLGALAFVLAFIVISGCSGMAIKSNTLASNVDSKESTQANIAFDDIDGDYNDWD